MILDMPVLPTYRGAGLKIFTESSLEDHRQISYPLFVGCYLGSKQQGEERGLFTRSIFLHDGEWSGSLPGPVPPSN